MQKNKISYINIFKAGVLAFFVLTALLGFFMSNVKTAYAENIKTSEISDLVIEDLSNVEYTPLAVATSFAGGDGTEAKPYQINSAEQLALLAKNVNNGEKDTDEKYYTFKNYILTANIDLSGKIWVPIGAAAASFMGSFDGNGYTISNLYTDYRIVTGASYFGLFGQIFEAKIFNVQVKGATVIGTTSSGIIAGQSMGSSDKTSEISSCYVTGVLSSTSYAGGIVGSAAWQTYISTCFSNVKILSATNTGLITGGGAVISNCYAESETDIKISSSGGGTDCIRKIGDVYYDINNASKTIDELKELLNGITDGDGYKIWYVDDSGVYLRGVGNVFVDGQTYSAKTEIKELDVNYSQYNDTEVYTPSTELGSLYYNGTSNAFVGEKFNLGENIDTLTLQYSTSNSTLVGYVIFNNNCSVSPKAVNSKLNNNQNESVSESLNTEVITGMSNFTSNERQGYFDIKGVFDYKLQEVVVHSYLIAPNKDYSYDDLITNINYTSGGSNSDDFENGEITHSTGDSYNYRKCIIEDGHTGNSYKTKVITIYLRINDTITGFEIKQDNITYLAEYFCESEALSYDYQTNSLTTEFTLSDDFHVPIMLYFTNITKINFYSGQYPVVDVEPQTDTTYWIDNTGRYNKVFALNANTLKDAVSNNKSFYSYDSDSGLFPTINTSGLSEKLQLIGWSSIDNFDPIERDDTFADFPSAMLSSASATTDDIYYLIKDSDAYNTDSYNQNGNTRYKELSFYTAFRCESLTITINIYDEGKPKDEDFNNGINIAVGGEFTDTVYGNQLIFEDVYYNYNFSIFVVEYDLHYDNNYKFSINNGSEITGTNGSEIEIQPSIAITDDLTINVYLTRASKDLTYKIVGLEGDDVSDDTLTSLVFGTSVSENALTGKLEYNTESAKVGTELRFYFNKIPQGYYVKSISIENGSGSLNADDNYATIINEETTFLITLARNTATLNINEIGKFNNESSLYNEHQKLQQYKVEVYNQNGICVGSYEKLTENIIVKTGYKISIKSIYSSSTAYFIKNIYSEIEGIKLEEIGQGSNVDLLCDYLNINSNNSLYKIEIGYAIQEQEISFNNIGDTSYFSLRYEITRTFYNDGESNHISSLIDPANINSTRISLRYGDSISVSIIEEENAIDTISLSFDTLSGNTLNFSYLNLLSAQNKSLIVNVQLKTFTVNFNLYPMGEEVINLPTWEDEKITGNVYSKTVKFGESVDTIPSSKRDAYNFQGWSTEKDSNSVNYNSSTEVKQNYELYPVWEIVENEYSINYETNFADVQNGEWKTSGVYSITSGVKYIFPTLISDSHNFLYWTTTYNGNSFTFDAEQEIVWDFTQNMTFTAVWEAKQYTIKTVIYNEQSSDGSENFEYVEIFSSTSSTTIGYRVLQAGDVALYNEKGYTLIGYSLSAPTSSTKDNFGELNKISACDANATDGVITVYALYKNHYLVNLSSGGNGTVSINNVTEKYNATYGTEYEITFAPDDGYRLNSYQVIPTSYYDIIKEDYKFTMPDVSLSIIGYFTEKIINITYKANQEGQSGCYFKENNGTTLTEKSGTVTYLHSNYYYDGISGMPTPYHQDDGYVFANWTDSDGNVYDTQTICDKTDNFILYPTWERVSYEITFDYQNNSVTDIVDLNEIAIKPYNSIETIVKTKNANGTFSIQYLDTLVLPNVMSASHTLTEWTIAGENKSVGSELQWTIKESTTLKAVWENSKFNVETILYVNSLNDISDIYSFNYLKNGATYLNQPFGTFTSTSFGVDANNIPTRKENKPNEVYYQGFVGYSLEVPSQEATIYSEFPNITLSNLNEKVIDGKLTIYLVYRNYYELTIKNSNTSGGYVSVKIGTSSTNNYYESLHTKDVVYGRDVVVALTSNNGYTPLSITSLPNYVSGISQVEFTMPNYDLELSVNFDRMTTNIMYDVTGGTFANIGDNYGKVKYGTTEYVYGNNNTSGMPTPSKNGYTFAGWFDSEVGGKLYNKSTMWDIIKENATLYAQWTSIKYEINVNIYTESIDSADKTNLNNYRSLSVATLTLTDGTISVGNNEEIATFVGNFAYNSNLTLSGEINEGYEVYSIIYGTQISNSLPFKFIMMNDGDDLNVYLSRKDFALTINKNTTDIVTGMPTSEITANFGQTITLPVLNRVGYELIGYSTSPTSDEAEYTTSYTQNGMEEITLYAIWKAIPYQLTVKVLYEDTDSSYKDLNVETKTTFSVAYSTYIENNLTSFNQNVDYKTAVTISNIVATSGYSLGQVTFNGTTLNGDNGIYTLQVPLNGGEVIIYVERLSYTLQLDLNINNSTTISLLGWSFTNDIASRSIKFGYSLDLPDLSNFRAGFDFLGWAQDGEIVYDSSSLNYVQPNLNCELEAVWGAKTYNITYNFNEDNPCGDDKNVVNVDWLNSEGVSQITAGTLFTYQSLSSDSHNFLGWTVLVNGKTYTYKVGQQNPITWNYGGDATLTAIWETKTFNVSFVDYSATLMAGNRNSVVYNMGQTLSALSQNVKYGDVVKSVNPELYCKNGYTFVGYYNQNENWNLTDQFDIQSGITSNTVIYLLYKNYYSLTLVSSNALYGSLQAVVGDEELYLTSNVTYGENVELVPTATAGYNFKDYSTNPTSLKILNNKFTMVSSDVIVTANFEPKQINITYNANGGQFLSGASELSGRVTFGYNDYTFNEKPIKNGYTFSSWNTKQDGSGNSYTNDTIWQEPADCTLYAVWTPLQASVIVQVKTQSVSNDDVYELSEDLTFTISYNAQTFTDSYFERSVDFGTTVDITNLSYNLFAFTINSVKCNEQVLNLIPYYEKYQFEVQNLNTVVTIYLDRASCELTLNANTSDALPYVAGWNFTLTDGIYKATNTFKYGASVMLPYIQRSGFNLDGWSYSSDEIYAPETLYEIKGNSILTAIWSNKFSISVEIVVFGDEIAGATPSFEISSGDVEVVSGQGEGIYTSTGKYDYNTLMNLNINSDGYKILSITGIQGLENIESQNFNLPDKDCTIIITFTQDINYAITLFADNADGWNVGSEIGWVINDDLNYAVKALETEPINLITPYRNGYQFVGWSTTESSDVVDYTESTYTPNNTDFNLYAVWEIKTLNVQVNYYIENIDEEYEISVNQTYSIIINGTKIDVVGNYNEYYEYNSTIEFNLTNLNIASGFTFSKIIVEENTITTLPSIISVPDSDINIDIYVSRLSFDVILDANANGDNVQGLPTEFKVKFGQTKQLPTLIRTTGYDFLGWTLNADGSGDIVTSHTQDLNQTTYYAKWTKEAYSLTLKKYINGLQVLADWNFVLENYSPQSFVNGVYTYLIPSEASLNIVLTKDVYKLDKAVVNTSEYKTYNFNITMPSQDLTIEVYYIDDEYTFTLNASNYLNPDAVVTFENQGSYTVNGNIATVKVASLGQVSLLTPKCDGYEFLGWCTEENGQGDSIIEATYTQLTPSETTYYARWGYIEYDLSYDIKLENANDDNFTTVLQGSQEYENIFNSITYSHTDGANYNELVTVNFVLNSGYIAQESDFIFGNNSSLIYSNETGYTYSFNMPIGNVNGNIVEIKIRRQVYTLTFDDGVEDGVDAKDITLPEPMQVKYNANATLPDAERVGYTFKGWSRELGGSILDNVSNFYVQGAEDEILYANWEIKSLILTTTIYVNNNEFEIDGIFNLTTNSLNKEQVYSYSAVSGENITLEVNPLIYSLDRIEITGANYTSAGAYRYITVQDTNVEIKIYLIGTTYELKLDATNYLNPNASVSYDASTGWVCVNAIATYSILSNGKVTLITPKCNGYTFDGWYSNPNGEGVKLYDDKAEYQQITATNITLYAKWSATPYDLTYVVNTQNINDDNFDNNNNGLNSIKLQIFNEDEGAWIDVNGLEPFSIGYNSEIRYVIKLNEGFDLNYSNISGLTSGKFNFDEDSYTLKFTMPNQNTEIVFNITRKVYTLTYVNGNNNVEVAMPESINLKFEQQIILPELTADGCEFVGWNSSQDGTGTQYVGTFTQGNDNTTLYAIWEISSYNLQINIKGLNDLIIELDKISFVLTDNLGNEVLKSDGVNTTFTDLVQFGTELTLTINAGSYYEVYLIEGIDGDSDVLTFKMGPTDKTIDITFKAKEFTLTLDASTSLILDYEIDWSNADDWNVSDNVITKSLNYNDVVNSFPIPSISGLVFQGWYTKLNGEGEEVTSYTQMYDTDTTLFAKYSLDTFNITIDIKTEDVQNDTFLENSDGLQEIRFEIYNSENQTWEDAEFTNGSVNNIEYLQQARFVLTLKDNFELKLENIIADELNGSTFNNGNVYYFEFVMTNVDAKITFNISRTRYSLIFDKNTSDSVTGLPETIQLKVGQTYIVPDITLQRKGYNFLDAWAINNSGTMILAGATYTQTAQNTTLYAQWQAISYNLTYELDGGSPEQTATTITYEDNIILPGNVSKDGYTISKWVIRADSVECDFINGNSLRSIENKYSIDLVGDYVTTFTLSPIWQSGENTFTLNSMLDETLYSENGLSINTRPGNVQFTFYVNNVESTNFISHTGDVVKVSAVAPAGYRVKEWQIENATQINPDGDKSVVEITNFTSNIDVIVVLEPIELEITVNGNNGTLEFASGVYNVVSNKATTLTGVKVELNIKSIKGYVFDNVTASEQNVNISIDKGNDKVYVSEFTTNLELQSEFIARVNTVKISGNNIEKIRYQVVSDVNDLTDVFNTYNSKGISATINDIILLEIKMLEGYSIVAISNEGYEFNVNYPYNENTERALIDNINEDTIIQIDTKINEYSISASVIGGDEFGSVQISGNANENDKYNYGTEVTFTATSAKDGEDEKYDFIGWFEDETCEVLYSNENPKTISVTSNLHLYAKFQIKEFTVKYQLSDDCYNFGYFEGNTSQTVTFGANAEQVTTLPNAGYNFVHWEIYYGNEINAVINTNAVLNISDVRSNVTCVAVFEKMDITITINTTIEGTLISDGIEKVSIKYQSGAIGESISTDECLSMTLNAKTNTDITISATAKDGYTLGEYTPVYVVSGNVSVIISGNEFIINAKENNSVVSINFGKKNNVINSTLEIDGENGGGVIRYQEGGVWQHIGPTYTTNMKTESSLTYKVFVYAGYVLGTDLQDFVDNGTYNSGNYNLTISTSTDYTGLDSAYFTSVYDVTISGYKTDIDIVIPIERVKTIVTFHNVELNDPSKTFTASIAYGTTIISGVTSEQLCPTSETYMFVGWENELGYMVIDSSGNLKSKWLITDKTYDLYGVWQERLLQIIVEVDPIYALQSASTLYKTVFANSFIYGLQPEEMVQNGNILYFTRPLSKLYLTLPKYKSGYIFDGFYLKNPTTDEYEKVGQASDGASDYATSTNCLLNIKGYSYYTNYQNQSEDGTIIIKLSFKVVTSISAENFYASNRVSEVGGTVKFVDLPSVVNGSIISVETNTNTLVKMIATPNKGYEFVKWVDENGEEISLSPELEINVSQSKHYTAIFKGELILITSDYNVEVQNGNPELVSAETYYHVGDIIKFKFNDKVVGYEHTNWMLYNDGVEISLITGVNPTYTLTADYKNIKVNPTFTMASVKVQIIMSGQGEGDGTIKFASGWTIDYNKRNNTYELTIPYETNLEFNIVPNVRYKFDNATVKYGNGTQNVVEVQNNLFKINYIDYNDVRTIQININLIENYWREYVLENGQIIDDGDGTYSVNPNGGDFIGDGTEEYPYEINSINDISKLAFIINNNIKQNNNQKAEYANAIYELNQNINFEERFWTPIGTKTNPFKGTFYIRGDRNNIFVNDDDPLYPSDENFAIDEDYYTLYGKLFGYLDGAKIIVEQQSLLVLWIVLGVLGGIALITIVLIVISNQRRKNITREKTVIK